MKKNFMLAILLASPVMAGVSDMAPEATSWAVEVAGVHTWTMADSADAMHNINTWGAELTGVYHISDNWAATLRFTWADGSGRVESAYPGGGVATQKLDVANWSLMAGARYTLPISEKLSCFCGVYAGLGRTEMKSEFACNWGEDDNHRETHTADDVGLAYSVETGLKYDICESLYVIGSVGFRGYWTTPNWGDGSRDDQQTGVSVSAGLGWEF
ncbi:MAG: outer membrane beta-barrel protein [Akkermansia sp.]|nr:outer membrane beta-barrel protein [Akkermansia sp.]